MAVCRPRSPAPPVIRMTRLVKAGMSREGRNGKFFVLSFLLDDDDDDELGEPKRVTRARRRIDAILCLFVCLFFNWRGRILLVGSLFFFGSF